MNFIPSFTLLVLVAIISCKKTNNTVGGIDTNPTSGQPGVYSGNKMTISSGLNLVTPLVELGADTVFSSYNLGSTMVKTIPTGFENKIISVYIPKGYFAVVAANEDGTGESASFLAIDSAVKVNLPTRLRNNVSFIRYIKINNPDKKGTCAINSTEVQLTASSWYYGWSINRQSFTNQQFVPMTWGKGTATDANAKYLVERSDVDHLLSFNEPDGVDQSNIPVDTAVVRYRVMIKSGLRLL
ncbi:MAG: glycosyl hydrolase, partial [Dolichospermum sp.]